MCDGPKQEQNRKTTRKRTHNIYRFRCSRRVVAKQYNENSSEQNKQRRTGRMRNLHFKTAAYEFSAIPKTTTGFTRHDIHSAGKQTYRPSCYIVNTIKFHFEYLLENWQNNFYDPGT